MTNDPRTDHADGDSAEEPRVFCGMALRRMRPLAAVVAIAVAAAIAFGMQLQLGYVAPADSSGDGFVARCWSVLASSCTLDAWAAILLVLAVFALAYLFLRLDHRSRFSVAYGILALVFAFCMVVGGVLSAGLDVGQIDRYEVLKAGCSFLAWAVFLYMAIAVASQLLQRSGYVQGAIAKPARHPFTSFLFERRPLLGPFLCIVVCWLPYLVFCYPGTTDPYDNLDQLQQWHGIMSYTSTTIDLVDPTVFVNNHHPVFHTMLLGSFVDFGNLLGSQSFGLFLFVLMQFVILALVLADSVNIQRDFQTPTAARMVLLVLYCFVPLFPGWAICATKDTLFTAFVFLFVLMLVRLVRHPEHLKSWKWIAACFAVALLVSLVRNNGVFILVFVGVFLLLSRREPSLRRAGCATLGAAVCFVLYASMLLPALGVSPGSIREALSLPFEQVAYIAYSSPQDIDNQQKQVIGQLFDYDALPDLYSPQDADPLKYAYKKTATREDVVNYLQVWAQLGASHPTSYFMAFLAHTYDWFYPGSETSEIWLTTNRWGDGTDQTNDESYRASGFEFDQTAAFQQQRSALDALFKAYAASPLRLLTNMAVCAWAVVFLSLVLLRRKDLRSVIPLIPALVGLLVCFASPLNGFVRYSLPFVIETPFLISFAAAAVRVKNMR